MPAPKVRRRAGDTQHRWSLVRVDAALKCVSKVASTESQLHVKTRTWRANRLAALREPLRAHRTALRKPLRPCGAAPPGLLLAGRAVGRGRPSTAPPLLPRLRLAAPLLRGRPSMLPLLLVLLPPLLQLLLLGQLGRRPIHAPRRLATAAACPCLRLAALRALGGRAACPSRWLAAAALWDWSAIQRLRRRPTPSRLRRVAPARWRGVSLQLLHGQRGGVAWRRAARPRRRRLPLLLLGGLPR